MYWLLQKCIRRVFLLSRSYIDEEWSQSQSLSEPVNDIITLDYRTEILFYIVSKTS